MLRVEPVSSETCSPPVAYNDYYSMIRQNRLELIETVRARMEKSRVDGGKFTEKLKGIYLVVSLLDGWPHNAVVRQLGGGKSMTISTDRLELWRMAKEVREEMKGRRREEREIEEEREKSNRAASESASDVIDELGFGEEWPRDKKPERGEALPKLMQEEKRGKRVRAVEVKLSREKDGKTHYRVVYNDGNQGSACQSAHASTEQKANEREGQTEKEEEKERPDVRSTEWCPLLLNNRPCLDRAACKYAHSLEDIQTACDKMATEDPGTLHALRLEALPFFRQYAQVVDEEPEEEEDEENSSIAQATTAPSLTAPSSSISIRISSTSSSNQ
uniref:C3H1-type domain-containing protein n=1 Tax=Chromera velia CCMP2878 TaxID=1169474 RepID=A0A0G4G758_9ALVE|eukprot:Cvel_4269.t1-p1 / transcript=Cvel_4269.t1 / gene=Cvel_4269 / organism=Chromera_velia_CCMP2878 / gene_product=hypothetical protein / transcript_product=hypothetical protein / location=Cvel_scaffold185:19998-23768(-) / protein_length=330 / sequence_SO=supercontig / SO=protein_coding / is_pseudo=false